MTAFMMNIANGETVGFEATVEKDKEVFLALVFEPEDSHPFEFQTENRADMEEFFFQVAKAKLEYERLTGIKLPD